MVDLHIMVIHELDDCIFILSRMQCRFLVFRARIRRAVGERCRGDVVDVGGHYEDNGGRTKNTN